MIIFKKMLCINKMDIINSYTHKGQRGIKYTPD